MRLRGSARGAVVVGALLLAVPVGAGTRPDPTSSSTTPLDAAATFTGPMVCDPSVISVVANVLAETNHEAATGQLALRWSMDQVGWHAAATETILPHRAVSLRGATRGQCYRILYTNGPHAQTAFRLETLVDDQPGTAVGISHISAMVHMAGAVQLRNQAGTVATFTGSALDVNCTGCASASSVAVTHVSAVTHVAAARPLPVVPSPQSGLWPVAAHQAGTWALNVQHISGVTHIAGTVTCSNCSAPSGPTVVSHVSSTTHVAGLVQVVGHVGANQSGPWAVTAHAGTGSLTVNQGGVWVAQAHQAGTWTLAHVSSTTHMAGTLQLVGQDGTRVTLTGTSLNIVCISGCGTPVEPPTFSCTFDRIAPAANKYLATLFNTSATRKVVVHAVYVYNWQMAAVTGVILEGEFRRITARTAGTSVTAASRDSSDTLSAGIACDTASTAVTDSTLLRRVIYASEETKIGALTLENYMSTADPVALVYQKEAGQKGLTLRQNQGLSIKNITSSTVGTISLVIIFTDEPA